MLHARNKRKRKEIESEGKNEKRSLKGWIRIVMGIMGLRLASVRVNLGAIRRCDDEGPPDELRLNGGGKYFIWLDMAGIIFLLMCNQGELAACPLERFSPTSQLICCFTCQPID